MHLTPDLPSWPGATGLKADRECSPRPDGQKGPWREGSKAGGQRALGKHRQSLAPGAGWGTPASLGGLHILEPEPGHADRPLGAELREQPGRLAARSRRNLRETIMLAWGPPGVWGAAQRVVKPGVHGPAGQLPAGMVPSVRGQQPREFCSDHRPALPEGRTPALSMAGAQGMRPPG